MSPPGKECYCQVSSEGKRNKESETCLLKGSQSLVTGPSSPSESLSLVAHKNTPLFPPALPGFSRAGLDCFLAPWGLGETTHKQPEGGRGCWETRVPLGSAGCWPCPFCSGIPISKEVATSIKDVRHLALPAGRGVP